MYPAEPLLSALYGNLLEATRGHHTSPAQYILYKSDECESMCTPWPEGLVPCKALGPAWGRLLFGEAQVCWCLQGAPGLSEGQTEGNRELRVKLGRLLCELGKLGLVHTGTFSVLDFKSLSQNYTNF